MSVINSFADSTVVEVLRRSGMFAEMNGFGDLIDPETADACFGNLSDEVALQCGEVMESKLREFRELPLGGITEEEKLTCRVTEFFLRWTNNRPILGVDGAEFLYHSYPVNQLSGAQIEMPLFLSDRFAVSDAGTAERYLRRLSRFESAFLQVGEALEARKKMGIVIPRAPLDRVIPDVETFLSQQVTANPLLTGFKEKIDKSGIAESQRNDLLNRAKAVITDIVYPAYRSLVGVLENLRARAPEEIGIWRLPGGDRYYGFLLKANTTTDHTPAELHEVGLEEMSIVEDQIRSRFGALGYSASTIPELYESISGEGVRYPDNAKGRRQVLEDAQRIVTDIRAKMPEIFDRMPRADCVVRAIPESLEGSMSSQYSLPANDGSQPGTYYVNIGHQLDLPRWSIMSLGYHEAVPGHHFQMAIARELNGLPLIRRIATFPAFIEGWAKYAEAIPWEHGFNTDPYGELGRMKSELGSTVNLVLDTGIHHKGWTRERSIHYHMDHLGSTRDQASLMVDRITVNPGQACAYKVGYMAFRDAKRHLREVQGEDFDIRRFHRTVLEQGALPLPLLNEVIAAGVRPNEGS